VIGGVSSIVVASPSQASGRGEGLSRDHLASFSRLSHREHHGDGCDGHPNREADPFVLRSKPDQRGEPKENGDRARDDSHKNPEEM